MIQSPAGYQGDVRIKRYLDFYQAGYGVAMLSSGTTAFSPATLFAANEPGVWYDPSDLSTMFQDAAGTTPVTAVEQPVGLRLDKSRGLVLGSELVTNGDFSSATGWTVYNGSISGGEYSCSSLGLYAEMLGQSISGLVAGRTYQITITVSNRTGGGFAIGLNSSTGGTLANGFYISSNGTKTFFVRAGGAASGLFLITHTAGTSLTIDNISVKELPGSHAYQTTDVNRPVLSARYNLLTRTEEFDNAAWTKDNLTVSANTTATTDPLGGNTADRLVETAVNSNHSVSQGFVAAGTYRWSAAVKAAERTWCALTTYDGSVDVRRTFFDLSNGTIGTTATGHTASISDLGNGWYRVAIVYTATATNNYFYVNTATGNGGNSYLGDITKGIYIWGADLRVSNDGVGLPAYQRVTTATDYDTTGFPLYLRYNGANSAMQTAAINFTSTDKMSVFAGVRKLSDGGTQIIAELSASWTTSNGTFALFAGSNEVGTPGDYYRLSSHGDAAAASTTQSAVGSGYAAPTTNILTATSNISGDLNAIRVNQIAGTDGTGDQGSGNFGNHTLYIGARAAASNWFQGRDYGLVVLGRTPTAAEITSMETWMNSKAKAF